MSENYINRTFDSCKSVFFPDANDLALTLLCGPWGSKRCTPER